MPKNSNHVALFFEHPRKFTKSKIFNLRDYGANPFVNLEIINSKFPKCIVLFLTQVGLESGTQIYANFLILRAPANDCPHAPGLSFARTMREKQIVMADGAIR